MRHLVFANIAWHKTYDGKDINLAYTTADWPEKKANKYGEIYNFCEIKGKYYGYVAPNPPRWSVDLSNFGVKSNAEYVDGITVIWTAPDPNKGGRKIIGWYKNARMYSELKKRPKPLRSYYLLEASVSNCILLNEKERTFEIHKQFRTLWYAKGKDAEQLKRDVLKYIENYLMQSNDEFEDPVEVENDFSDVEGRKVFREHLKTERSSRLVKEFKDALRSYQCSVCGFDFEGIYGILGRGFIEAHHVKPVFQLKHEERISVKDLLAVCSNCHRMLHRKVPPIDTEKLKLIVLKNRRSLS